MNTRLVAPPWGSPALTSEAMEALEILGDGIWHEASVDFIAERDAKLRAGKTAPKGMQKYLNKVLVEHFRLAGWDSSDGYFCKGNTWVRVTFRHQMSLGSDFLSALKVCKLEGVEFAMLLAANRATLDTISPNDAAGMVSFEKLQREAVSLDGALDIPLVIGELTPKSNTSSVLEDALRKERPRDKSVPVQ